MYSGAVTQVEFLDNERIASGCQDGLGSTRFWDSQTGQVKPKQDEGGKFAFSKKSVSYREQATARHIMSAEGVLVP